jgi:hypothetical protein
MLFQMRRMMKKRMEKRMEKSLIAGKKKRKPRKSRSRNCATSPTTLVL